MYKLEGQRFGRLVVKAKAENKKYSGLQWHCQCDCGNSKVIASSSLRNGLTRSCGCLISETTSKRMFVHGKKNTREYRSWRNMIERCERKTHKDFKNYGGRGIKVHLSWRHDFLFFLESMGACPEGFKIERIDNNKGYEPGNCRWATQAEQSRNTRRNRYIEGFGERRLLCDWSELLKIKASSLLRSLQLGRTLEQATRRSIFVRCDRKYYA